MSWNGNIPTQHWETHSEMGSTAPSRQGAGSIPEGQPYVSRFSSSFQDQNTTWTGISNDYHMSHIIAPPPPHVFNA